MCLFGPGESNFGRKKGGVNARGVAALIGRSLERETDVTRGEALRQLPTKARLALRCKSREYPSRHLR